MRRPIIYNSGKYTGLAKEVAIKKFEQYRTALEEKGYKVIDPTLIVHPEATYEQAMHTCLATIPFADGIFMQPDWRESGGACKELMKARVEGKRVYWNIEDVPGLIGIAGVNRSTNSNNN